MSPFDCNSVWNNNATDFKPPRYADRSVYDDKDAGSLLFYYHPCSFCHFWMLCIMLLFGDS